LRFTPAEVSLYFGHFADGAKRARLEPGLLRQVIIQQLQRHDLDERQPDLAGGGVRQRRTAELGLPTRNPAESDLMLSFRTR